MCVQGTAVAKKTLADAAKSQAFRGTVARFGCAATAQAAVLACSGSPSSTCATRNTLGEVSGTR